MFLSYQVSLYLHLLRPYRQRVSAKNHDNAEVLSRLETIPVDSHANSNTVTGMAINGLSKVLKNH